MLCVVGCGDSQKTSREHFAKARQHEDQGRAREAIIEYRVAVQQDSKFAEARYRLALAYENSGDLPQSVTELTRAADLLPDDVEVQLRTANMLLMTGQFEDAATRAQRLLERQPQNVDALVILGRAKASLREADSAIAAIEQAQLQLPNEPRLYEALGGLQRSRGNIDTAEKAFQKAVELRPSSLGATQALAAFYVSTGRAEQAEKTLLQAAALDETGYQINRDLAVLYLLRGRDADAEPRIKRVLEVVPDERTLRVALGDLYFRHRKFREAIEAYEPLSRVGTKSFAAATARTAYAEFESGRQDAALDRIDMALTQKADDIDLLSMRARMLLAIGRFTEAADAARAAHRIQPDRFDPLYVLGTVALQQGRTDEALKYLRAAEAAAPRAPGPKLQLAIAYLGMGDGAAALRHAKGAFAAAPDQVLTQLTLARVLIATGDTTAGEKALSPLGQTHPQLQGVQIAQGDLALRKRDASAARRAYESVLKDDPNQVDALRGLVNVHLLAKQGAQAVVIVERALAAHPGNGSLLLLAAQTHLAVGNAERAESHLQQALKVASEYSTAAYGLLAGLYLRQHRLDEARQQFAMLASRNPQAVGPNTMLGIVLQLQNKPQEARAVYEALLRATPDAGVAANNLAMILVDAGQDLDIALNHAQAAKRAEPDNPNFNDTLGVVYLKKGLPSLAIAPLELAVKAEPRNAEFRLHLGQAYAGARSRAKGSDALQPSTVSGQLKTGHR
jgi:tetratricopeptide (TPR) repeat protein